MLQIEERVMDRMAASAMVILIMNVLGRLREDKQIKHYS